MIAVQVTLRAARWRLLLPIPAERRPAVSRVIPVLLIGYLGNAILPARLGEAVRAALLARRERISATETLGSVILERIIDTVTLAGFALAIALLVGLSAQVAAIGAIAIAAGLAAIVGITAAPRILARVRIDAVERIVEGVRGVVRGARIADRPRTVAAAFGLSLAAWILDAALFLLAGRALGIELPLHGAIVISAVAALSTAVPSAPGFIGTLDFAISTTAQAFGVEPAAALALAIVVHAVALVPVALAGVVAAAAVGRDGSLVGLRASIDADTRAVTSL